MTTRDFPRFSGCDLIAVDTQPWNIHFWSRKGSVFERKDPLLVTERDETQMVERKYKPYRSFKDLPQAQKA